MTLINKSKQNKKKMNCVWLFQFCTLIIVFIKNVDGAMNEKQLKAAGKMVRNVCQPKHKATDDDIEKMHKGDWNIDRTAMCYMSCVLNSQKLLNKDNTVNVELAKTLANKQLPPVLRDATLMAIENCKDAAKTLNDKCVSAYEVSKCIFESAPEHYFLP